MEFELANGAGYIITLQGSTQEGWRIKSQFGSNHHALPLPPHSTIYDILDMIDYLLEDVDPAISLDLDRQSIYNLVPPRRVDLITIRFLADHWILNYPGQASLHVPVRGYPTNQEFDISAWVCRVTGNTNTVDVILAQMREMAEAANAPR